MSDTPRHSADDFESETIDAATGLPDPTPRLKLSSLKDVRLEMAAVYRQVKAGNLEDNAGSKRVFMLRQIADVIVSAELEARLTALEDRQAAGTFGQGQRVPAERRLN